ncbi:hypothetical protein IMAU10149_01538 [Lactobacillus helveticus]|uniref:hypothetical protein n=1 Tax=Lactobacillus helveticus TaxID=1587 RepID=UPI0015633AF6|nr:hypothetical protein [Lactobacillus helveticus]NRO84950.1 hypothetical protein [Lactobacillus helveticus]
MIKENRNYIRKQPNPDKFYFPAILFCVALVVTSASFVSFFMFKKSITNLTIANILIVSIWLVTLVFQLKNRRFLSYLKSLSATREVHNILVIPKEVSSFNGKTKVNNVHTLYNHALWSTYVEYRGNKLIINLKIPQNLEAATLLEDKRSKLREAMSSMNTDYSFSPFERIGQYYVSVGTN